MKKVSLLVSLILFISLGMLSYVSAENKDFNDLSGHWGEEEVRYLIDQNLINGYPDGSFKPNNSISRAEAATIISLELNLNPVDADFSDVSDDYWANEYIGAAAEAGIINGYEDGTFQPKGNLTRGELATILTLAYDLEGKSSNFADTADHWASVYIQNMAANHLVAGYEDGTFKPNKEITRAEFASFEARVLNKEFRLNQDEELGQLSANVVNIKDGSALNDVSLILLNDKGEEVESGLTEQNGEWNTALSAGVYSLHAEKEGYENIVREGLEITKGQDEVVNLEMKEEQNENSYSYQEIGEDYTSNDSNMTVRVEEIQVNKEGDFKEYTITYTETNQTSDEVIPQGSFKIYYMNGENEPQYGFFNDLYPGESSTSSYTFKALNNQEPLLLEYGTDLFFNDEPSKDSLKWKLPSVQD